MEALVAPHPDSVGLVNEWLASHGIPEDALSRSPGMDWVKIKVPVGLAEKMLETVSSALPDHISLKIYSINFCQEYQVWTHDESGDSLVRTTSYSLPEHLMDHVDLVQPTTVFSRFSSMKTTYRFSQDQSTTAGQNGSYIPVPSASGGQVDASCNQTITVSCLKQLYNAVGYTPAAAGQNQIAVTAYLDQYANFEDLQLFYADEVPAAVNTTFTVISINGMMFKHHRFM